MPCCPSDRRRNGTQDTLLVQHDFLVQCIFGLLGIGVLVPWNAFISAKSYFASRFFCGEGGEGTDNDETTSHSSVNNNNLESVIASLFNLSSVSAMGVILLVQWWRDTQRLQQALLELSPSRRRERIATSTSSAHNNPYETTFESTHEEQRERRDLSQPSATHARNLSLMTVTLPFMLTLTVFVMQTILTLIMNISRFELWTLFSIVVCGAAVSIGSSGIVAIAGYMLPQSIAMDERSRTFSPEFALNPYMTGQSLGGLLISTANFIAATWEDPSEFCNSTRSISLADASHYSNSLLQTGAKEREQNHSERHVSRIPVHYSSLVLESKSLSSCSGYQQVDWAVFGYFLSGSVVLILCLMGFAYVHRKQSIDHDPNQSSHHHRNQRRRSEYEVVREDYIVEESLNATSHVESAATELENQDDSHNHSSHDADSICCFNGHLQPSEGDIDDTSLFVDQSTEMVPLSWQDASTGTLKVWRQVKGPAICIFWTFFVTLSLFPGVTSEIVSVRRCQTGSLRIFSDLYTPWTFVWFNLGDLLGRILVPILLPYFRKLDDLPLSLIYLSLIRFIAFPLLLVCPSSLSTSNFLSFHVPNDLYSLVVQFLLAVSNGILISVSFVVAPSLLSKSGSLPSAPPQEQITHDDALHTITTTTSANHDWKDQGIMSRILQLSLAFGLLSGSFFSFVVTR